MRRLYSSAIAKKHVFPPECELTLRVWQLHVLTQIELFTDDSSRRRHETRERRVGGSQACCVYGLVAANRDCRDVADVGCIVRLLTLTPAWL